MFYGKSKFVLSWVKILDNEGVRVEVWCRASFAVHIELEWVLCTQKVALADRHHRQTLQVNNTGLLPIGIHNKNKWYVVGQLFEFTFLLQH